MRAMIVAVLAAVVALGSASSVLAKTKATADSQPAVKLHKIEKSLKGLNLTQKQHAEVKGILAQAKQDGSKAKSKAEKAEINRAAYDKIRTTVLTDEQRKHLDEKQTVAKAKHNKIHARTVKAKAHKTEKTPAKA